MEAFFLEPKGPEGLHGKIVVDVLCKHGGWIEL